MLAKPLNTSAIWTIALALPSAALAASIMALPQYGVRAVIQSWSGPPPQVTAVLARPLHPYTRGLLDSLPRGGGRAHRLVAIPGMTPSLGRLPPGCAFAPRCARATTACDTMPDLAEAGEGRAVRCFHPLERAA